ncbi:hypothetical protein APTSU1_001076600 [Apodemus speciosus]|uniref:Uncharacterized protein n=1 Tax=Apodemus speciosus TaxID=105296 RepID=A0ABQ0F8D0_APOSI
MVFSKVYKFSSTLEIQHLLLDDTKSLLPDGRKCKAIR